MPQTDSRYQMNEEKKRRLSASIIELVKNTVSPIFGGVRRRRCFSHDGIVTCLADKHLELFEDLAREILKPEQIREKFSERYICDSLEKVIINVIKDRNLNNASRYFQEMVSHLEDYSICHVVYIPLAGIEMTVQSLAIGNIVVKEMTRTESEKVVAIFDKATSAAKDADQETWQQIQAHRAEILKTINGMVCAEFEAIAESGRVQERAMEETRKVMDLFEYAMAAMAIHQNNSETRIRVGLLGDFFEGERCIPIISTNKEQFSLCQEWVGPLPPFTITEDTVENMRNAGVFDLSELLRKPQLNDFEKALLHGLHWFSSSRRQVESENRLLNLIVCLESFLTPEGRTPVSHSIAEGVALILGETRHEKFWLRDKIKAVYGVRSGVSHGGRKSVLNSDLTVLELLACSLIKVMVDNRERFGSRKQVLDWIDDMKFGTSPDDSGKEFSFSGTSDVNDEWSGAEILKDLAAEAQESLEPRKIPLEAIRVPARLLEDGRLIEDPTGDLSTFKPLRYLEKYEGVKAPGGNVFEWFTESIGPSNLSQIPAQGEELWLLASDQEPRWLLCDVRLDQSSPQMRMFWENVRTLTSEEVVQRDQHLESIIGWLKQYYSRT